MTSSRLTTIGVSIPIPAPDGEYLQQRRAEFGDPAARRIPAHITLVPPTEVDEATYAGFVEHCSTVADGRPPFEVILRGTGTFRPISDVVYIHVAQGVSACERLEKHLRNGPVKRDLAFYYHPHVTVAHNVSVDCLDRAFTELADFRADFVVGAFQLYEQGEDGTWRPVKDFALQGG
ncbi:MAG: 2'-5' RNA ligase family protein [Intrasporangium sp.]|uniref:2'-5' RNA ligase family protein n=1 Tax=Intrasporangium sp. TaxID=1925024 RepID=UPI002649BF3C|nr:2'-5' RNA ligase family protein [Intrasporangium sp.]MDN5794565.1 2'-5' RNA ligase family protein [Intrasporangium sp.]